MSDQHNGFVNLAIAPANTHVSGLMLEAAIRFTGNVTSGELLLVVNQFRNALARLGALYGFQTTGNVLAAGALPGDIVERRMLRNAIAEFDSMSVDYDGTVH